MTKSIVKNADSKGLIKDYQEYLAGTGVGRGGVLGRAPRTSTEVALRVIRNDPVVRAAVIKLVDKVVESGWRVQALDGNKKSRKGDLEALLRKVRFDRVIRKVVFNLILYNNAFVELRKKGGVLSDVNVLEPEFMRIEAKDNGDVVGYYQETGGSSQSYPRWKVDEVVHFKLDDFTSNVWSEFNIEALYETILIKDYARNWLSWLYKTNQFRPVLSVEATNSTKMKELLSFLKFAEQHVGKPIPVEGKLTVSPLQEPSIVEWPLKVISWCNTEVMKLLQVPEISVGTSDNGGRADGAEQREYLNTRVFNIHRLLEDDITYDLFVKAGFGKVEFVFGILDETVRTRVFENVQLMRNSNFTEDAILEYMEAQGVIFSTPKPLFTLEEVTAATAGPSGVTNDSIQTGNESMYGKKSADSAPSRQRQNSQDVSRGNKKL